MQRFTESPEPAPANIVFTLVGELGCDVTIRQENKTLWEGFTEKPGVTVTLRDIELDAEGRAWLDFYTEGPVRVEEGTDRRLAFAVYNVSFIDD